MFKAAGLLALFAPAAARELMPGQRNLLTTEADVLAATTTVMDFCAWVNTYTRTEHPGKLQRLADGVDYADDNISDGGDDLFDGGNYIYVRTKKAKEDSLALPYTRQHGPKEGALVSTQVATDNFVNYAMIYHKNVFAGVYKADDILDKFMVQGEMGDSPDESYYGNGAFSFASVDYEYFWIARQTDGYKGKYDMVVINSADGGKHCMSEYCYDSDYDYHRVWDTTDGFTKAAYVMWAMQTDGDPSWLGTADGESYSSMVAMYMAGLITNVLA